MIVQAAADRLPFRSGIATAAIFSPPYFGRRRYGDSDDEVGIEPLEAFCQNLAMVAREVRRVLVDHATMWVVIGDTSAGSGGAGGDHNKGGSKQNIAKYRQGPPTITLPTYRDGDMFNVAHWEPVESKLPTGNWCQVPAWVAAHLQGDGWYLRHAIVWDKGNARPESLDHTRRPGESHEMILMLTTSMGAYTWNPEAIPATRPTVEQLEAAAEGAVVVASNRPWVKIGDSWFGAGRSHAAAKLSTADIAVKSPRWKTPENGSVWRVKPGRDAQHDHPAVYPERLVERMIALSTNPGDIVLDPFVGSGTTVQVAERMGRKGIGSDLYRWTP